MSTNENTVALREQAVDKATIGSTIDLMGTPHRVCITDDGRKIAYPCIRAQTGLAA